jgi:hypothetical protein
MPIRLGDLADDNASLHVRCRQCGRSFLLPGKLLVQRHGENMLLTTLLRRMRCQHDRMVPDARILLESEEVSRPQPQQTPSSRPPPRH